MGADAADAAGARYAYLRKLDSHLQNLAAAHLAGRDLATAAEREALTLGDAGRRVFVDVRIVGDMADARRAVRALDMEIGAVSDRRPQRMLEGMLPVSAVTAAAGLDSVQAVLAVQGFGTDAGSVLSQGDAAHRGPQARALGPTGAGITVGVISDSISQVGSGVAGSQASGNLPGPASSPPGEVRVLQEGSAGGTDEGRAMAEIIFDTAPGIRNMLFTTGEGAATRASGIDNLVAAGAKVIADDVFELKEPYFQDGIVAQAVDRAKAAGVTYLASAGNRARQSWEGTYAPITDPRGASPSTTDFDTGAAADAVQTIGTFTDRSMFLSLQWDEPFDQASTDLALDVYDAGAYAFTVDSDNIATRTPGEYAAISVPGTHTIAIAIRRKAGTRNPFMRYIVGGTPTFAIAEHATSSGAINPDASSARGSLAVAAANHATPAMPEAFSSRGPAFRLFDVAGRRLATAENRDKPDLMAADGVATSVPNFNAFFGTSAATPSAAGVAALVLSAKPALPVELTDAILRDTSHTTLCAGAVALPDAACGFGFELADGAVRSALDGSPPVVAPTVSPPAPDGAGGWYASPSIAVAWDASDAQSPVVARTGCDPASVTTDTITTLSCSATSAGGRTTESVTIRHDATPPTAPSFSGIEARAYAPAQLPAVGTIACAASDETSLVSGCAVSGFGTAPGAHTLTATATNGAGLTSTATLAYTVVVPARTGGSSALDGAISALSAPKGPLKASGVARSGLRATLRAAAAKTKLKLSVTLRGRTVASATRAVGRGTVRLTMRLRRSGRARLLAKPGTLTIKVTGSAPGRRTVTLKASVRTKR